MTIEGMNELTYRPMWEIFIKSLGSTGYISSANKQKYSISQAGQVYRVTNAMTGTSNITLMENGIGQFTFTLMNHDYIFKDVFEENDLVTCYLKGISGSWIRTFTGLIDEVKDDDPFLTGGTLTFSCSDALKRCKIYPMDPGNTNDNPGYVDLVYKFTKVKELLEFLAKKAGFASNDIIVESQTEFESWYGGTADPKEMSLPQAQTAYTAGQLAAVADGTVDYTKVATPDDPTKATNLRNVAIAWDLQEHGMSIPDIQKALDGISAQAAGQSPEKALSNLVNLTKNLSSSVKKEDPATVVEGTNKTDETGSLGYNADCKLLKAFADDAKINAEKNNNGTKIDQNYILSQMMKLRDVLPTALGSSPSGSDNTGNFRVEQIAFPAVYVSLTEDEKKIVGNIQDFFKGITPSAFDRDRWYVTCDNKIMTIFPTIDGKLDSRTAGDIETAIEKYWKDYGKKKGMLKRDVIKGFADTVGDTCVDLTKTGTEYHTKNLISIADLDKASGALQQALGNEFNKSFFVTSPVEGNILSLTPVAGAEEASVTIVSDSKTIHETSKTEQEKGGQIYVLKGLARTYDGIKEGTRVGKNTPIGTFGKTSDPNYVAVEFMWAPFGVGGQWEDPRAPLNIQTNDQGDGPDIQGDPGKIDLFPYGMTVDLTNLTTAYSEAQTLAIPVYNDVTVWDMLTNSAGNVDLLGYGGYYLICDGYGRFIARAPRYWGPPEYNISKLVTFNSSRQSSDDTFRTHVFVVGDIDYDTQCDQTLTSVDVMSIGQCTLSDNNYISMAWRRGWSAEEIMRKMGVRKEVKTNPYLHDQYHCMIYARYIFELMNRERYSANASICLYPEIRPHNQVYLETKDMVFTVRGVTHQFGFTGGEDASITQHTTTIGLMAGRARDECQNIQAILSTVPSNASPQNPSGS